MDSILEKINDNREKDEASFVFSLWSDPELYADYLDIQDNKDTLKNEDAIFYYNLGKAMYKQGYKTFDAIAVETFLSGKKSIKKKFEEYGGMQEVEELKSLINSTNVDVYYDRIAKKNNLSTIYSKYKELFTNVERFDNATAEDVYNTFDLLNNSVALNSTPDAIIENLVIDEEFIRECEQGLEVGLSYAGSCPALNYITLGLPLGDLTMIAGHSGVGKSSFVFENIVLELATNGIYTGIISNEMRSKFYKILLLEHILTKDLNYWELTRKKIKIGKFTDQDKEMIQKAIEICKDKYKNIKFIKMFDNDTKKIVKFLRKLSHQGYQCIVWDTMKSDDVVDEKMWQQLTINARRIFQVASKNNISIVTTYQLALHTTNQRFLDATCLSNSKQIKEVFSEMIYMRPLWQDEYTGEKYDCKAYKLTKNEEGKTKVKTYIDLNKEKKYVVAFVDKTRNDEDKQQVLYEFNGRFNKWYEIGRCTIINEHR